MKEYYPSKKSLSVLFFTFFVIFLFFDSIAQNTEIGSPPLQNFAPTEYNAAPEIRSMMKSSRGFIYAASNNRDILEYDGNSWKKIFTPCNYVYSMVEGENGNIHIADGLVRCAGYLRPQYPTGKWEFIPLHPENLADSVWYRVRTSSVGKIDNQIYYTFDGTSKQIGKHIIFKFDKGVVKEHIRINRDDIKDTFFTNKGFLFFNGKQLFHKQVSNNTNDFSYDSLKNTSFFEGKDIYKIKDFSENELLIFGIGNNVTIYNLETAQITPFGDQKSQTVFRNAQLLTATQIVNGDWIFGSIQNGVIHTDNKGNIIQIISTKEGLIDNIVMSFAQDNQNQLWTGFYNGIAKIDVASPVNYWAENKGISGSSIYDIRRFENTIFAGTVAKLVYLQKNGNWKTIEGTSIENRLLKTLLLADGKEHLFLSSFDGIYEIKKKNNSEWEAVSILKIPQGGLRISEMTNYKHNPNRIYFSQLGREGINYIDYQPNAILKETKKNDFLKNTNIHIRSLEKNEFWGVEAQNRHRVAKINIENSKITFYDLDSGGYTIIDGNVYVQKQGNDSIFQITKEDKLEYDKQITQFLRPYLNRPVEIEQVGENMLWVYDPQNFFVNIYTKQGESYIRNSKLEQIVGKYFVRSLYQDENNKNIIWIGTSSGILNINLSKLKESNQEAIFNTLIRQVKIGNDSLIFDGNFFTSKKLDNDSILYEISEIQSEKDILKIDNANNSILFKVAGLFFIEEKRTQYSYFLEGLDEKWSDWTTLNIKEYNNLREGEYIFYAKSKNYLGEESEKVSYQFKVFPPWHRTTTAYVFYLLFGVGIIFGSTRFYTHRLRKQNEQLENIVAERTDELSQKNTELSTQNEEIIQQRDQLDIKNQKIEEQNKNIVSSINYAKRIQTALLPIEKRIKQEIPNHFIFYKPRDIVSGDFYWIEKSEDKVIIAVADCTGHGVPGAFMSMLGSSGLTDAVFQQNLTEPDLILTHLHNYIFAALKQSQSDNRDGMDVCIVVWDKAKNHIQYAGAMNPLYYVQNEELLQIKADKIPVGGTMAKERIYTPHTINLHVPTTIYLASDGYQDQFGGKEGRKFMTKKFRELLLEISHLPIKEQENRISQVFDRWKGKIHQIDDVLVMGIRFE